MDLIGTTELCGRAGIHRHELDWLIKRFPGALVPQKKVGPYKLWPLDAVELVHQLKERIKAYRPRDKKGKQP